jgi:hypothetical protein
LQIQSNYVESSLHEGIFGEGNLGNLFVEGNTFANAQRRVVFLETWQSMNTIQSNVIHGGSLEEGIAILQQSSGSIVIVQNNTVLLFLPPPF